KQTIRNSTLVSTSFVSSALIMHFGLTSSAFGLIPVTISALTGGFLSGYLISRTVYDRNSSRHFSWYIPLAGTITALVPVIFVVCAFNMHDEFPKHSFLNKLLGQYHDKISPLHEHQNSLGNHQEHILSHQKKVNYHEKKISFHPALP
ncbi:MAG: hypothetical protein D3922_02405, partial [Candidatus Electrothrix sp. AR1]|nr:hypothetical protein [Candidatus Electrothrix sp. AR1]